MNDSYFIECPYCGAGIEILKKELNCKIFRHATFKENLVQINPHAKEKEISTLKVEDKIYGCGMPFYYDGQDIKYIDFSDKFIEEKLSLTSAEDSS